MNLFQLEPIIVQEMDPSSSSTTQYNQERDWLSCSTSTTTTTATTTTQDVTIEDEKGGTQDGVKNNNYGGVVVEREHMFDKVVTPSDVGKLNRLVIPKQHAEKYFPLDTTNNNNNNSSSSCGTTTNNNENKTGLLLNFEDRTGKSWRFRYSYWNSSQSYVMTKGWSRFVKEKQLSAGDIVSFQRAVGDDVHSKNTFFIDWRRRPPDHHHLHHHHHLGTAFSVHHSIPGWGGNTNITTPSFFLRSHPHDSHPHLQSQPHHNALWDHYSNNNNNNNINNINNNVSHLSPINGNIMNMVPYNHSGSRSGSGSGSLILLRSPVPSSASIINHHPYHLSRPSWTTSREALQEPNRVYDSVPVVHGKAPAASSSGGGGAGKRSLRLFGVNMEYDHQLQLNSSGATNLSMCSNTSTANLDAPQN